MQTSQPTPLLTGSKMAKTNIGKSTTIQTLTSGSGTYTTPVGIAYIKVKMIGGGAGGNGSQTGNWGPVGSAGGDTTFGGAAFLKAGGGSGGGFPNAGAGGTNVVGSGPTVLVNMQGTGGGAQSYYAVNYTGTQGTPGSSGPFGGGGFAGAYGATSAGSAAPNSGAGGGGGGVPAGAVGDNRGGGGGAAGGYLEVIITAPAASYAYAIGAGGALGTAGTNGTQGGNGGSGVIIVEEYY
jgi:hypothetical protein